VEFFTVLGQWAWVGWLVLIAVFLVVEMLTLTFTFLMVGVGGLAGLVADLFGAPVWLQVVIAAIVAVLLIFGIRPALLNRLRRGEDAARTNVFALIGLAGTVVMTTDTGTGQVKLANGDIWTARAEPAATLPVGSAVQVVRIEGATAFVRTRETTVAESAREEGVS
jgi:membrane protein implicated in regulation of membrane protease activity